MEAPVIVLAGVRATLRVPSPLLAIAIMRPEGIDQGEAWGLAALALLECWPLDAAWPAPLRPRPWRVGEKAGERGREVFDGLVACGVPIGALLGPVDKPGILQVAAAWAVETANAQWGVAGAKDFCVVPAAGSSAADSVSAGSTVSPPPGGTV